MKYLFIFALMSTVGWFLEVGYRSYHVKRFVNPGLMLGCSLPVYGIGGVILNLLASISITDYKYLNYFIISLIALFILTFLEFIGGILIEKIFNIKLWDYSNEKFNFKGVICIRMSLVWGILSFIYFLFLNNLLNKISRIFLNFKYSYFFLGIYIGIFIFDFYFSIKLLLMIKEYSKKQKKIINFELLKMQALNETSNIFALKKIFYLLYPYKNIYEFIIMK